MSDAPLRQADPWLLAIGRAKAGGAPQPRLFAVGPVTRGAVWEITAVPDICIEAARTASVVIQALQT